ncbi:MAG: carboxypeptidase-like regulatory domain-containing protein [Gemmatimonadaceae bacterium]|nr:carboxypeptidase-like regulatory domain-containing protein [Gemmatimonadaceae bacterium]
MRAFLNLRRLGVVLCALAATAAPSFAQAPDTLVGRVFGDSARSTPIAGATVLVTRSSDRALQQAVTDAEGRWQIVFADGSGDYLVYISATGYAPGRRRVQRAAAERRFVVDLVLKATVPQQLAAVKVRAQAPPPVPREVRLGSEETGASERWNEGVTATVAPNARGDLAATATTVPGFTQGAGGVSLLGAAGALTTLNGAAIPGVRLPRAANLDARFTGTTFDATRGGFSGSNYDVRLGPGNRNFQQRSGFLTLDAPAFTVTDATGRALGLPSAGGRFSAGADGELIRKTATYNVALDLSRSAASPASLLTADAATLARVGLRADSAAALRAAATTAGLPLGAAGAQRVRENLTWLARLDDTRDSAKTFAVSSLVSLDRQRGVGLTPSAAPSATGEQLDAAASLQLLSQRYFGRDRRVFNELRASGTVVRQTGEPTLLLPAAAVTIGSGSVDPTSLASLTLGGDPTAQRDLSRSTLEVADELAWYPTFSTRHLIRGSLWARSDRMRDAGLVNPYGTVQYNSIADLANNVPAAFTRTLAQPVRDGAVVNAAAAVSYRWNPKPGFQMISGARLEYNDVLGGPVANPALSAVIDVDNTITPTRWHLSPRLGFTWRPGGGPVRTGQFNTNAGTFLRPRTFQLRGGIGEFRDILRPELAAGLQGANGLLDGARGLRCVGSIVPVPDWDVWANNASAIPRQCVGGTVNPLGASGAAVQFIDPSYDVARSWRASLGWTQDLRPFILRVDGLAALNLNQQSTIDANFTGTPFTTIADEGRPLYVRPTSIDAASGAVSIIDSRRTTAYGVARGIRSDGRSEGAQLTAALQLDPFALESNVFASLSYTLQGIRQRFRGFDGAGVGDPFAWEWARGTDDARHTILAQLGTPIRRGNRTYGTFTIFARLQSGLPYTPIVQGDVDGDGTPGDRAFVFNPSTDTDATRAAGMRALLSDSPRGVTACLERSLGQMAGRNSCESPWAVSTNARLDIDAASRLFGRRTTMSVNLANPLALFDQLLHGESGLRGWGGPSLPDPVLLVPRGFDAGTNRFRYSVNPRFGDTRPGRTLLRNPFQLTVDFSFNLTRNPSVQELERNIEPVARGAFVRPSADTILRRYEERVSSIHQTLLDNADTLFLTRDQIEASMQADTAFRKAAREIYRPLAEYLSALPQRFAGAEALAKVKETEKRYEELFWQQRDLVKTRLTPLQLSALPRWVQQYLATRLDPDWERWPRYIFREGSVSISINN